MHAFSSSSQLPSQSRHHRTAYPTENDNTRTMSPDLTTQTTTDRAATEEDGPTSQLERNRIRAIRRRERETSQERMQRREVERIRAANRRQNESPAEREVRRQKGRLRAMRRRENETEDEKRRRREMNRVRMAERRRELKYVNAKDDISLRVGPSGGEEDEGEKEKEGEEAEHFREKRLSKRTRMCRRPKHGQSQGSDACSDVSDSLNRSEPSSSSLPQHSRISSSTASLESATGTTRKRRNRSTDGKKEEEALPSLPSAHHAKQGADIIPASGSTLTSHPIGTGVRKIKRRPAKLPQPALALHPTPDSVQQFGATEENPKHPSHHPTVAVESLLSDNSNIASSSMVKSLGPGMAFSSVTPVVASAASASSSSAAAVQRNLVYQSQGYKQLLPPMLPTSTTMANAVAVAAAAAAAAAGPPPPPPPPSSSLNINDTQSASAIRSLVSTSLAMHKQAAAMGIMFQTAAPQMQQIAPVHHHHHHHPAASVAGLGIGATLPTASFASNMVVGPLGSFAQPTAAALGQNPVMTTPQSFTSSQSIANNTAATIQGMRTIAEILPTTAVSVAGPSGQTMTQFQYSAPQTTQAQLQEASESMLAMTMAGAPSAILHTQATAETMAAAAAAVAAATVSSNPGPANGTPIARFHPSGVQPHSVLQRHGINNQTPSYNHHLPYYYTQR